MKEQSNRSLVLLSLVFFSWGILTSSNSVLVPHFQSLFSLNYEQAMLVQLAFYVAPFAVSIPTSILMARRGYKFSLCCSLMITIVGGSCLYVSLVAHTYILALCSIFIAAMGIAAMQVVANPYVAKTGQPQDTIRRLTIASAINSTGATMGPIVFAAAMISIGVANVYALLLTLIFAITLLIYYSSLPDFRSNQETKISSHLGTLMRRPLFLFGAFTLFVYIGVEVSVGTVTISYLSDEGIGGISTSEATTLMSVYWAGSLLGRMLFSFLAGRVDPMKALFASSFTAISLIFYAIVSKSLAGGFALIAIGLCNSFMYPVIFSRSISNLGESSGAASAILIMCSVGGGVLPMIQACLIEPFGITYSYVVPLTGYLLIALYAFFLKKHSLSEYSTKCDKQIEEAM